MLINIYKYMLKVKNYHNLTIFSKIHMHSQAAELFYTFTKQYTLRTTSQFFYI